MCHLKSDALLLEVAPPSKKSPGLPLASFILQTFVLNAPAIPCFLIRLLKRGVFCLFVSNVSRIRQIETDQSFRVFCGAVSAKIIMPLSSYTIQCNVLVTSFCASSSDRQCARQTNGQPTIHQGETKVPRTQNPSYLLLSTAHRFDNDWRRIWNLFVS